MGSVKQITLFFLSYLIAVQCGPIQKRQIAYHLDSDWGSAHLAPLPTIIAGRAALSDLPLRYGESEPLYAPLTTLIAGRAALSPTPLRYAEPIPEGTGAFGYEFTVPIPPSLSYGYPTARADDCSHTSTLIAPEPADLPIASLPPPPPPLSAPIITDCREAPELEFTSIETIPPPPPPPPAELPLPMPIHTEPCLEAAPASILPAPAPIYTEPAELPPPPPSHIITEPLNSPSDCFETAPAAPAIIAAPLPPEAIELAPLPPPPPQHLESPIYGEHISALDCHGAAPVTASFTYPSALEQHYGDTTHTGAGEGLPEILDARSLYRHLPTSFEGRTGISHPFAGISNLFEHYKK